MLSTSLLLLVVHAIVAVGSSNNVDQVHVGGQISISGIYIAHSHTAQNYGQCSEKILPVYALLSEAQRWALAEANRESPWKGQRSVLGTLMFDSCENGAVGLQRAAAIFCDQSQSSVCEPNPRAAGNETTTLFANGYMSSEVAKSMDFLFQAFCLPVLCSGCSSADFDDAGLYRYLLRVYPSDKYQAKAVAELLDHQEWRHVFVLADESSYGRSLKKQFQKTLKEDQSKICVESYFDLPQTNAQEMDNTLNDVVEALSSFAGSSGDKVPVLVLFLQIPAAEPVLRRLQKERDSKKLVVQLVATDTISSVIFSPDLTRVLNYTLATEALVPEATAFIDYLKNLTYEEVGKSSWLVQLLEQECNCTLSDRPIELLRPCNESKDSIAGILKPSFEDGLSRRAQLVFRSIHLADLALQNLSGLYCPRDDPICGDLKTNLTGMKLYEAMSSLNYTKDGDHFAFFNGTNAATPIYGVYQFIHEPGRPKPWMPVGTYRYHINGTSETNMSGVEFPSYQENITSEAKQCFLEPSSCEPDERMTPKSRSRIDKTCCFHCSLCKNASHYITNKTDNSPELVCKSCEHSGEVGNATNNYHSCKFAATMKPTRPEFVAFIALGALLGLLSLVTGVTVLICWKTPVAKASQRDLSLLQCLTVALLSASAGLSFPNRLGWTCGGSWAVDTLLLSLLHGLALAKALRARRPSWYLRMCHKEEAFLSGHVPRLLLASVAGVQGALLGLWWATTGPRLAPSTLLWDRWWLTCTANESRLSLFLLLLPLALLLATLPLLKALLYVHFQFQAKQAQWALVGQAVCLAVTAAFVPAFTLLPHNDVGQRDFLLLALAVASGWATWAAALAPLLWTLTVRRAWNSDTYVLGRNIRASSLQGPNDVTLFRLEPVLPSISHIFTAQKAVP